MKSCSAFSRRFWRRSPWIAAACTPSRDSWMARRSAPRSCPHEHQRPPVVAGDGGRHLHLVELVHLQEAVGHLLDGHLRRRDLVEDRIVLVAPHERTDHAVQGRGEQQHLVPPFHVAEDPLDLGEEAHVGHAVGLVHDDVVDVGHRELALLHQVDDPSGGGDHEVDARRAAP